MSEIIPITTAPAYDAEAAVQRGIDLINGKDQQRAKDTELDAMKRDLLDRASRDMFLALDAIDTVKPEQVMQFAKVLSNIHCAATAAIRHIHKIHGEPVPALPYMTMEGVLCPGRRQQ